MRIADTRLHMGAGGSAAAVAEELKEAEEQGKAACGNAAHGQNEREPARVSVGALSRDAAEADKDEGGGKNSGAKDENAGAEEFAGVWLHWQ
jgi:hypothetical protein